MVNASGSQRSRLLQLLRSAGACISGTEIGKRLGISRVAVWKHIQQLAEEGYRIESGAQGYRLTAEPDYPTPSDPELDPRKVHISAEVESTMSEAAGRLPPAEGVEFWLARRQRRGRGRENRPWHSPEGGLYCTALFRPRFPAAYAALHLINAGMALADLINRICGSTVSFRWPNDLYLGRAKLGGLMLELDGGIEAPVRGALGIGINIADGSVPGRPESLSLSEIAAAAGRPAPTRRELFTALRPVVETALADESASGIRDRFEKELSFSVEGRRCIDGEYHTVRGLSLCGSLIVAADDGRLLEIEPGGRTVGEYRTYR